MVVTEAQRQLIRKHSKEELEQAFHVFLLGLVWWSSSNNSFRPGDEILVSDNVYGPTKEILKNFLKI